MISSPQLASRNLLQEPEFLRFDVVDVPNKSVVKPVDNSLVYSTLL